ASLEYNWTKVSDGSTESSAAELSIPSMTSDNSDSYRLNITSTSITGLTIFTKQIDLLFTLGQEDSVALYNLFVELGTTPDKAIEMRDWVDNDGKLVATQIDNYGRVIDLDLSNRALTSLPTSLTIGNFGYLETVNLADNQLEDVALTSFDNANDQKTQFNVDNNLLFFDELIENSEYISSYAGQTYSSANTETATVTFGDPYSYDGGFEIASLEYNWTKVSDGSTESSAAELSIPSMTSDNADSYRLNITSTSITGLTIFTKQIDLLFTLGQEDSVALYNLFVELGTTPDKAIEMRNWVDNDGKSVATQIDNYGRVIDLDLSDRDLTSMPTSLTIENFGYLETVNLSDNQLEDVALTTFDNANDQKTQFNVDNNLLFFDDLIDNSEYISSYDGQTFSGADTETATVTFGDPYSYDGGFEIASLEYNWTKVSDGSTESSVAALSIPSMTSENADSYRLNITSTSITGLTIFTKQIDLLFTLGQEDSVALYNLFVELGTTPDKAIEMRDWVDNDGKSVATQIDNYGRVIDLDLSNRDLTSLPTSLTIGNFGYLETVNLSDNQLEDVALTSFDNANDQKTQFNVDNNLLFFDELIENSEYISSYAGQTYSSANTETATVTFGDSYSYDGGFEIASLEYNWTKVSDGSTESSTSLLSIPSMTSDNADSYRLNITSTSITGLTIFTKQIDLLFTLGQEDSVALYNLFVELGTTPDKAIEMRDWVDNDGKSVA
ncbi:hypothetical protein, partial [Flammeovirga sp. EKP202]|uniref:hypothetical protein n=1 Tax=Flammeovirga sp. EKP202 TaxID=2770592 RepID=UPI00165F7072